MRVFNLPFTGFQVRFSLLLACTLLFVYSLFTLSINYGSQDNWAMLGLIGTILCGMFTLVGWIVCGIYYWDKIGFSFKCRCDK